MADKVTQELERIYTIPLRTVKSSPRNHQTDRAIRFIKAYLGRHMKAEDVWIDASVNERIWERGMYRVPSRIRVRARRFDDGVVEVSLPEVEAKESIRSEIKARREKAEEKKEKKKAEEKPAEKAEEGKAEKKEGEKAPEKPGESKAAEEAKAEKAAPKTQEKPAEKPQTKTKTPEPAPEKTEKKVPEKPDPKPRPEPTKTGGAGPAKK